MRSRCIISAIFIIGRMLRPSSSSKYLYWTLPLVISQCPLVSTNNPYLLRNSSLHTVSEHETEDAPFVAFEVLTKSQASSRALYCRVVIPRWREGPHLCLPRSVKKHGSLTDSDDDCRYSEKAIRKRSSSLHGSVGWISSLMSCVGYID